MPNHRFLNCSIYPSSAVLENNSISPITTLLASAADLFTLHKLPPHSHAPLTQFISMSSEWFCFCSWSWLYADKLCKSTDNQAPRFNSQSLLLLLLLLRSRCCRISSQDTTEDEPLYKALLYVNRGDPRPVPVIYAARNKLNTFQSSHYHYNIIIIIMGWMDGPILSIAFVSRKKRFCQFRHCWSCAALWRSGGLLLVNNNNVQIDLHVALEMKS